MVMGRTTDKPRRLCGCGCGKQVKKHRSKFIRGHYSKLRSNIIRSMKIDMNHIGEKHENCFGSTRMEN